MKVRTTVVCHKCLIWRQVWIPNTCNDAKWCHITYCLLRRLPHLTGGGVQYFLYFHTLLGRWQSHADAPSLVFGPARKLKCLCLIIQFSPPPLHSEFAVIALGSSGRAILKNLPILFWLYTLQPKPSYSGIWAQRLKCSPGSFVLLIR